MLKVKNVSIEKSTRSVIKNPFFFLERKKNKRYNATIIIANTIIVADTPSASSAGTSNSDGDCFINCAAAMNDVASVMLHTKYVPLAGKTIMFTAVNIIIRRISILADE